MILNLGHTVGHAIEQATRYKALAARRSRRLGNDCIALRRPSSSQHHWRTSGTHRKPHPSVWTAPATRSACSQAHRRNRGRQEEHRRCPSLRRPDRHRRCRSDRRPTLHRNSLPRSPTCFRKPKKSALHDFLRRKAPGSVRMSPTRPRPCRRCSIPSRHATTCSITSFPQI